MIRNHVRLAKRNVAYVTEAAREGDNRSTAVTGGTVRAWSDGKQLQQRLLRI